MNPPNQPSGAGPPAVRSAGSGLPLWWGVTLFALGAAAFLCLLSIPQTHLLGADPFDPLGFIVPALFGALAGTAFGFCFLRHRREILDRLLEREESAAELRAGEERRRRLEHQLQHAQRMEAIGRLAGGVAHDFNNLLTVINGNAELALLDLPHHGEDRSALEEIRAAGLRAAELTSHLLTFSRKQPLSASRLDLGATLEGSLRMLERVLGEDIELEVRRGENLPQVIADATRIEQVLLNLAVNARDAMPRGGHLLIELRKVELEGHECQRCPGKIHGPHLALSVSDTGSGMSAEIQEHIFEPFFTTKGSGQGTGLGLAIVFGIVHQHGGHVHAYSEPGRGSTFRVYLPVAREEEAAATVETMPEQGDLRGGSETILLVEDDKPVRHLTAHLLEQWGYEVLAAASSGAAQDLARERSGTIDLLLSDVVLPDLNGRELFEDLAAGERNLRALFMSGYTDNIIAHHGILDAGVHFIQKPFSSETLARKVRAALDQPLPPSSDRSS